MTIDQAALNILEIIRENLIVDVWSNELAQNTTYYAIDDDFVAAPRNASL